MIRGLQSRVEPGLTLIDLFAGAGGTGYGFRKAGFRILRAIEIDPNAALTYALNLGPNVQPTDITRISPGLLREELGLKKNELTVLVGCPPCQGFSRMRNEDGADDPRNNLVRTYFDFVDEFRPKFAVFENVPGLVRSAHGRRYYNRLIATLKESGYSLVERIVDAADYGVPQHRRRIIVIAGRDGEEPSFPEETHGNPSGKEVNGGLRTKWVTVRDAIGKYPKLRPGENGEHGGRYPNHIAPEAGERVLNFIRRVPHDGGSRTEVEKRFWLRCHKDHVGHNDVYGRLAWDRPAGTITTGCTNLSKGRFVHPDQDRALTSREAACLQGFPDEFIFCGASICAQIGNAVPPPLAYAIGMKLRQNMKAAS